MSAPPVRVAGEDAEWLVETSVLVAVLLEEPDARRYLEIIGASNCVTAPTNLFEAVLALSKQKKSTPSRSYEAVSKLVEAAQIAVAPFTAEMIPYAVAARERYGRGRNALNMGDCLSYAAAKQLNLKLLYKGDDFAETELA